MSDLTMMKSVAGALLAIVLARPFAWADTPASQEAPASQETIVFVRHGEKPEGGLGQLNCQGLNRALALPAVLAAKFGTPTAVFAPNPSKQKDDDGKPYDYVRPLATIEPTAIRFSLPIESAIGFAEADTLADALQEPAYRGGIVVVAWEHKLIDVVVQKLLAAHGGGDGGVPKWRSQDFDGIYVVKIAWTPSGGKASFARDREGLDGQPTTCPK